MHHNTKRPRSPTRQKSATATKPIVLGKQSITQSLIKAPSVGHTPKTNLSTAPSDTKTQDSIHAQPKFNPHEFVKQQATRNVYDICMIKKFIGKKILIPAKGLLITPKIRDEAKLIKAALLVQEPQSKLPKSIIMHVICIQGTMVIVNGYSNYLAIGSISYKDIETNDALKHTEIKLVQYPKVSNSELRILLDYFA